MKRDSLRQNIPHVRIDWPRPFVHRFPVSSEFSARAMGFRWRIFCREARRLCRDTCAKTDEQHHNFKRSVFAPLPRACAQTSRQFRPVPHRLRAKGRELITIVAPVISLNQSSSYLATANPIGAILPARHSSIALTLLTKAHSSLFLGRAVAHGIIEQRIQL